MPIAAQSPLPAGRLLRLAGGKQALLPQSLVEEMFFWALVIWLPVLYQTLMERGAQFTS